MEALSAWAHRANALARRWRVRLGIPAYLVLLRVGFTLRLCLHRARCALTAPFHPYRLRACARSLAVYSLLHWPSGWLEPSVPDVIRHTALRSSDFPPPLDTRRRERQRSSSRLLFQCTVPGIESWAIFEPD